MNRVLLINYCAYLPGEKAIKRTFYLFDMLRKMEFDAHFLTSDFNHYEKQSRSVNEFYSSYPEYKTNVHFVHMKPYKKNISINRFLCNYLCEKELLKWFVENGNRFDIVYISLPTYYLTSHIRRYCDRYNIKLVIDVNDLWPDSLKNVIHNQSLYRIFSAPFMSNTINSYKAADAIVAVSEEYLKIAEKYNDSAKEKMAVYIGAMLDRFDLGVEKYSDEIIKEKNEFWITYIGTLGISYDFDTVMMAIKKLDNRNIVFKIMGQGPEEQRLRKLAQELDVNADFVGFVQYEKMAAYLSKSDICVNCIKQNASQSIINKAADYFASGRPVINCGPCQEMIELIDDYDCGINYKAENVESCSDAILTLMNDHEKRCKCGANSRLLAEEKFDRKRTHGEIIEMLNRL